MIDSISQSANASPELKKPRRKRAAVNGSYDAELPHWDEGERGILGCCIIEPACVDECQERFGADARSPEVFHDLRNAIIYRELIGLRRRLKTLDLLSLVQHLKEQKLLDSVGGVEYVSSLPDQVPSAANLEYYTSAVWEKFVMRKMVQVGHDISARVSSYSGPIEDLIWSVQSDIGNLSAIPINNTTVRIRPEDLMNYVTEKDPNAIVGVASDGRTTRYLCKGYGGWLIGPSGIGKSSLVIQIAILWCLGMPFMGITPTRKMRVLVVQAENDEGDLAEMVQGVCQALGIDSFSPEFADLNDRLKFVTERSLIGDRFCGWLRRQIELHRADIVFVDPLLSFAGIDVSRQDQCSRFLRNWLNPVLSATGAVMIGAHHTGKPKLERGQREMTAHDYAYIGIGSSELVNWARIVMVVVPRGDVYELKLAKRGPRAGATHLDSTRTTSLWLRHAQDRIFWEQVEPPQEPEPKTKGGGGRPSKVDQLLAVGLGGMVDKLTTPTGLNELARLIENYAASQGVDVKITTCKEAIVRLVANKVLKKEDGKYSRI